MEAVAFAEAGDFDTAQEFQRSHGSVLLVVTEGDSARKSLLYAVNLCKRIKAGLEIIYESATRMVVKDLIDELRRHNINFTITETDGCVKKQVIELTRSKKSINAVVVNSSESLDAGCSFAATGTAKAWEGLGCPLVVVGA